jgi:hypothetical protein
MRFGGESTGRRSRVFRCDKGFNQVSEGRMAWDSCEQLEG